MSFVGVDVGGTFLKVARLSRDGSVESVMRQRTPPFLDMTGEAREIDPDALEERVKDLVEKSGAAGDIEGVFVTGQMAGVAFVDEAGEAIAPLMTWQDRRSRDVEGVLGALSPTALASLGDGLRVGSPVVAIRGRGAPEGAHITSLLAFVAGRLAGLRAAAVHVTDAASWGMLDIGCGRWSSEALECLGIGEEMLPTPEWELTPIGQYSRSGAPVYCATGDHQTAVLGAGLHPGRYAGEVSINIATGCQVSIVADTPSSRSQSRPYFDGSYLHTVTHLPAGRALTKAVLEARGSVEPADWAWARGQVGSNEQISEVVGQISAGVADAVESLEAKGRPVVFSGGVAQRFEPLRRMILDLLQVEGTTFPGDDAALAGLGILAARQARGATRR